MRMFSTTRARGDTRTATPALLLCGAGSVITPRPREMSVVAPKRAYDVFSTVALLKLAVMSQ